MAFLLFDLERCFAYPLVLSGLTTDADVDGISSALAASPHGDALLRSNLPDFFAPILAAQDVTVVLVTHSENKTVCDVVKKLIEQKTGFSGIHVSRTDKKNWTYVKELWSEIHPERKELRGQQVLFMDDYDNDELRKDPNGSGLCVVHCKPFEYRITRRHLDAVDAILSKYGQKVSDPKQTGILDTFDEDEDEQSLSLVRSFLEQTTRFTRD
jgi:hypothetical protein